MQSVSYIIRFTPARIGTGVKYHMGSVGLNLHRSANTIGGFRGHYQITFGLLILALDQLADRTKRIDNTCPRRVGLEIRQGLQCSAAIRITRQCKDVLLAWFQTGDRGLHHLCQALIKQRHVAGCRTIPGPANRTQ